MSLSEEIQIPSKWNGYRSETMVEVYDYTSEYDKVKESSGVSNPTEIYRVENKYLYGRYLLKKKCYEINNVGYTERVLLHATFQDKARLIAEGNFNYRLVNRCKFGQGVCFTPYNCYANREGCRGPRRFRDNRAMIVTKVLIGTDHVGSYDTKIPRSTYDTTGDICGNVYVKYYDDEYYPEYIVFYNY